MTLKTRALMGASALLMAAGAANATDLYGNGATLPSQVVRQAEDCYGTTEQLAVKQATGNTFVNVPAATIPGSAGQTCATTKVDPTASIFYVSTGSGDGIRSVFRNDGVLAGDYLPAAGVQTFPKLHYGVSETSLGATEVNSYNNGGTVQGVAVVAPGVTPGTGQFKNPNESYGPLVQFPLLIAPVVIAYDPVYKKVRNANGTITEYTFNIAEPRADGSGGLKLDQATYCKIFNGQITNWNQIPARALNGRVSLKDPDDPGRFNVPLQIVGRNDSSGTTSLWTRHLAAACESLTGNQYADSTSTLPGGTTSTAVYDPAQPNAPVSGEVLGKYTRSQGNEGVSKYVDFSRAPGNRAGASVVQGRIAYLSADFALPASNVTNSNPYNLHTASLRNAAGRFIAPTPDSARAAFGVVLPPDSTARGAYDPAVSDPRDRANPQDWVEPASKLSPLANPAGRGSYPIVGTSNFLGYTCYAVNDERAELTSFLSWYENGRTAVVNDPVAGVLARSGFSALPPAWRTAITQTFLSPVAATSGLGLQIKTAGQSGVCSNKVGAAPNS